MAKTKKLLSLALAVAMISSLFCLPASAATHWTQSFDMSEMMGSSAYGRHGTTSNEDYNKTGVYGKGTDGVLQLDGGTDEYLGLTGNSTRFTFSASSRTVISYDVAFDSLAASGNNHVSLLQFANSSGSQVGMLNFVQITQNGAVNVLDKGNISTSVQTNCWNNITAVIDLGADSKAYSCTIYLNGTAVKNVSGTLSDTAAYVRALRICNRTTTGIVYVDNLSIASYPSTDTVNLTFTTSSAATTGNEALVDTENKAIKLTDIEMTVGEFKAATTGFVVLDENGAVAEDDAYIANANIYAVYANGINSYYEPYTVSVKPPVIEGTTAAYQEIINSETKEIRLVDMPDLTVGEFLANTTGATVTLLDGSAASDETFLRNCKVRAALGELYNIEYTLVTARSYALENETFDGTYTKRTSTGTIYSGNGVTWTGNTNGKSGITFSEATGLGGKAATDKSLALTVDNAGSAGDVFMYLTNPYSASSTTMSSTHTMEGKLYIEGVASTDIDSIDIVVCGRVIARLMPDGSVKTTDGTVTSAAKWTNGEWIPFAFTYHKATNKINVYVSGIDTECDWTAAPFQSDIRFRPMLKAGATMKFAVDDVKIYTDSLEIYKYTVDEDAKKVTLTTTESLNNVPIIAEYASDKSLVKAVLGTSSNSIEHTYTSGNTVKIMILESLKTLVPLIEIKKLVPQ